jgi:hypothetical protein
MRLSSMKGERDTVSEEKIKSLVVVPMQFFLTIAVQYLFESEIYTV